MYSLPPTPYSVNYNYTDTSDFLKNNVSSSFSYLPINNNVFKTINCIDNNSSSNLLSKNTITSIDSCGASNLPVNNIIFKSNNSGDNGGNPSNLSAKNNVFQTVNINSGGGGSSNLSVNNNVFKSISNIDSSGSPNFLEEKSSNIPATKVLEEMYKTLELDIPPVFTFRQEIITQKFFCSAGFMNKWYDTEEAFPNQEGAKEAAAQSLLKIIMPSREYEHYLRAKEERPTTDQQYERQTTDQQPNVGGLSKFLKNLHIDPVTPETTKKKKKKNKGGNNNGKLNQNFKKKGNKQSFTPGTTTQKLSRRQKRKLNRQFRMKKKQDAIQAIFCLAPVSKQESKLKKVKFDEKILVLGQDAIPKPNGSMGLRSIMSQKNQSSSSQYNQISNEPVTYQMLEREFLEKEIRIPPSKILDEFCIISNISKPKYDFRNDGYGNYTAEVLVGDVKYVGERGFWHPDEAKECVAEIAFNALHIESDENTKMKFKERLSLALPDHPSNIPDVHSEAVASFILPQHRHESYNPAYPNYNNLCMQQFGPPPPPPLPPLPPLPPAYCNISMGPPRSIFNTSTNISTFDPNPFSAVPSVPNPDNVQQTHLENPLHIQAGPQSSTVNLTTSQQQNESIEQQYPYILHKLSSEKGWGAIDYQHSKTLKGFKCTCYIRKLKFTSNPCTDKDSAKNQAAKLALLALPEYNDYEF